MIVLYDYLTDVNNSTTLVLGKIFVGRTSSLCISNVCKLNEVLSNNNVHYQIISNMKENVHKSY